MNINIKIDNKVKLDITKKLEGNLRIAQKIALKKVVEDATDTIRRKVKDKHRHIEDSMRQEINGNEARIYLDPENKPAIYIHEGTKDHRVAPVNKKALYWVSGGEKRFSKGHYVKGIKKTKFLEKSFEHNKRYIVDQVQKAVRESI